MTSLSKKHLAGLYIYDIYTIYTVDGVTFFKNTPSTGCFFAKHPVDDVVFHF